MTLKRNLQAVIICQSINKTPIDAKPDIETGIRIAGSSKIVIPETKSISSGDCIEILSPKESPEITNAEMHISSNIRPVADLNAILVKEFTNCR